MSNQRAGCWMQTAMNNDNANPNVECAAHFASSCFKAPCGDGRLLEVLDAGTKARSNAPAVLNF
jgi:hypothetical protein